MSFYYLSKEMSLALNDILGRACSYNKDFLREDISITWINYKSENKSVFKGFGTGINNKKLIYLQEQQVDLVLKGNYGKIGNIKEV